MKINLSNSNAPVIVKQNGTGNRIAVNQHERVADRLAGLLKRAPFFVLMFIIREIAGSSELIMAMLADIALAGLLFG